MTDLSRSLFRSFFQSVTSKRIIYFYEDVINMELFVLPLLKGIYTSIWHKIKENFFKFIVVYKIVFAEVI